MRAKDEEEFSIVCNELKRQIADQLETLGLVEAVQENDMKGHEEGAQGHDAGRTDAKAKEGGGGGTGVPDIQKTQDFARGNAAHGGGGGEAGGEMKLNTPEIRPDGGVYEGSVTVSFVCSGADDVFFTTDGSVPHVASRVPSDVAPDKTFVIDTTQRALASVSREFTATLLCSCIVKAVGVRYRGGAGGTGREATLSPVKTSIKFGVRCATPQVDAAVAMAGMSNNQVHLRCQTHGAQILYAVEGLLELPPYADRKRLRQAFGKEGWFKVENRRRLKPNLTVAEMAEHVFAEDVVQLKSTFERDPAGDVLSAVECRLYRNQQKLEVLPGI
jgi:hypothetical protein